MLVFLPNLVIGVGFVYSEVVMTAVETSFCAFKMIFVWLS